MANIINTLFLMMLMLLTLLTTATQGLAHEAHKPMEDIWERRLTIVNNCMNLLSHQVI